MVGKSFEKCMMEKHGVTDLADHFMVMDTICDATQERQDAMYKVRFVETIIRRKGAPAHTPRCPTREEIERRRYTQYSYIHFT